MTIRSLIISTLLLLSSVVLASTQSLQTSNVVLKAQKQAVLSSELAGKIQSIPLQEGDQFSKDQDLVIFDCTQHEAELDKTKAQLAAKKAAHQSNSKMYRQKAISHVEFENSKAEMLQAQADVKVKQHTVQLCYIKAPYNGRLVKRHIYPHESVRHGQPLIEILDNESLSIELIVPSNWLAWLKTNQPFQLFVEETGRAYPAHVTKVLPRIDSVSQSVRLIGKLDNNHQELVSGMSGRAQFERAQATQ